MAHCRGDNDRPEVLGDGFIKATTRGEGMSGDHNQYQKGKSYLDFECPRCGHCCQALEEKQDPVAHVYLFDKTGRPLVAWDNAKDIKLGDKLYVVKEKNT